jgi:hypothetical protein
MLTAKDLARAHVAFLKNEPREIIYRASLDLVDRAIEGKGALKLEEAVGVLLLVWNRSYYQYRKFDEAHLKEIEKLMDRHRDTLEAFRSRNLKSLMKKDNEPLVDLFEDFEMTLGPVGTAKTLHLIAPRFFPLWDRKIAFAYGFPLARRGTNGGRYWQFMHETKAQCEQCGGLVDGRNPLKAIDEYNYCRYTRKWL